MPMTSTYIGVPAGEGGFLLARTPRPSWAGGGETQRSSMDGGEHDPHHHHQAVVKLSIMVSESRESVEQAQQEVIAKDLSMRMLQYERDLMAHQVRAANAERDALRNQASELAALLKQHQQALLQLQQEQAVRHEELQALEARMSETRPEGAPAPATANAATSPTAAGVRSDLFASPLTPETRGYAPGGGGDALALARSVSLSLAPLSPPSGALPEVLFAPAELSPRAAAATAASTVPSHLLAWTGDVTWAPAQPQTQPQTQPFMSLGAMPSFGSGRRSGLLSMALQERPQTQGPAASPEIPAPPSARRTLGGNEVPPLGSLVHPGSQQSGLPSALGPASSDMDALETRISYAGSSPPTSSVAMYAPGHAPAGSLSQQQSYMDRFLGNSEEAGLPSVAAGPPPPTPGTLMRQQSYMDRFKGAAEAAAPAAPPLLHATASSSHLQQQPQQQQPLLYTTAGASQSLLDRFFVMGDSVQVSGAATPLMEPLESSRSLHGPALEEMFEDLEEISQFQQRAEELKEECSRLRAQVEHARHEAHTFEHRCKSLEREKSGLEEEATRLKEQVALRKAGPQEPGLNQQVQAGLSGPSEGDGRPGDVACEFEGEGDDTRQSIRTDSVECREILMDILGDPVPGGL